MLQAMREFWRLAKPYWTRSDERWQSLALLGTTLALIVGMVKLYVLLNDWNRAFYDTLEKLDAPALFPLILRFSWLVAALILAAVLKFYLMQLLQIRWRRWMTEAYVSRWLENKAYYVAALRGRAGDNPDQRIAEDIRFFTSESLSLLASLVDELLTLISFTAILLELAGPLFLAAAVAYAVFGTGISHWLGRKLVPLDVTQQRREADFRYSLVRLRENAESVALSDGENRERTVLRERFQAVYTNFLEIAGRQKGLIFYSNLHANIGNMIPIFMAAPRFFAKGIQFGVLMQIRGAFGMVEGSLSIFIKSYQSVAHWRSVVIRLREFSDGLDELGPPPARTPDQALTLSNLSLSLPGGQRLLRDLDLSVRQGERLLISGRSGCGKSTLLRAIAGIWPYREGDISGPERVMFLPQRPYLPEGTLRAAVTYPLATTDFTEAAVDDVLAASGLENFVARLDESADWSRVMSPGEQQRVAFARAFLHRPTWLFLDEATSAVDEPTQAELYGELLRRLESASIISVAHRSSLAIYHERTLELPAAARL